jgi:hypothetical protein
VHEHPGLPYEPLTPPVAAHTATDCSTHADWPERPPVDVPAPHATHAADVVAVAPPAEYVFAGHGFAVPVAWPATHQYPAGHTACVADAVVALAQK